MIMELPFEQTGNLHEKIVAFMNKNYEAVIDSGLMDDILFEEYKDSVHKIGNVADMTDAEKQAQLNWLCTLLWQMAESSSNNLIAGRMNPVYVDMLKCVADFV